MRLIFNDRVRSWSLLKEPPSRPGEKRLAIEGESLSVKAIGSPVVEEEAFGAGRVWRWDSGDVIIRTITPERIILVLSGEQLTGTYQLRRMRWYPGNRWLMEKSRSAGAAGA